MPTTIPVPQGPVKTWGLTTVLAKPGEPAELCLGGVAESLPPQCGGPVLPGFDWSAYPGKYEEASGVRWGEFAISGTFDGTKFTSYKVSTEPPKTPNADDQPDFGTPCPEPKGGWRVLDPAKTTDDTMQATFAAAEKLPGYADAWVDQSRNHRQGTDAEHPDGFMNDPTLLTINIRVTDDPESADAELRKIWGGALCVTKAAHTAKELQRIQDEVNKLPGMLSSGAENGVMGVQVVYDDGSIQAWADATYGPGLVKISSALTGT